MSVRTEQGYIRVHLPGHPVADRSGYALEHRVVAYDAGMLTDLSMLVHHRNEVKDDNRVENLEVVTPARHHRQHARRLTLELAIEIRARRAAGERRAALAREYGVTPQMVGHIAAGRQWAVAS